MKKRFKRTYRLSKYIIYKETLIDYREKVCSFIGAFVGIGLLAYLQTLFLPKSENILLIGSFGASSVLIYGNIRSPLAQPRNLVGGHVVSALVGVIIAKLLPDVLYITAPLAVACSIVLMQYTKTLHPPGGATALIAIIGSEKIKSLGFLYVLSPVLSGTIILLVTALIFNNITPNRKYPNNSRFAKYFKRNQRLPF